MHEAVLSIGLDEEDVILAAARQCAGTLASVEWSLNGRSDLSPEHTQQVQSSFWMLAEALLSYQERHGRKPEILSFVRESVRPWLFLVSRSLDQEQRRGLLTLLAS
jgi:hypothetical protein